MRSDDAGADVAYAVTFHGGEDIYYVRIPNPAIPTGVDERLAGLPHAFRCAPNPFVGAITIGFDASRAGGRIRLEIFDLSGKRVATLADGVRSGPGQSVVWDGRREDGTALAPGVYLCRLDAGGVVDTRKVLRLR